MNITSAMGRWLPCCSAPSIFIAVVLFAGARLFWLTGIKYYSGASA